MNRLTIPATPRMSRLFVLFATCLSYVALSCGTSESLEGSTLQRIRERGVLRWGGDIQGGEPYVYSDPAHPGSLIGFEVEIANAIAAELGVRAEFVQADWFNLASSLNRGTFDIAMNGIEITPTRADTVRFSRPYFIFEEYLIVRANDPSIRTLEDVAHKRVGTLASSLAWELLRTTTAEVVPYEGVEEPYTDLLAGRTDAVLLDDIIARRYGLVKPGLRLAAVVGEGFYGIAARRSDTDLSAAINRALEKLIASGELRRILGRSGLDSARQARLASLSPPSAEATRASMDTSHFVLFLRGAATTVLVSASAMTIAVAFGLFIALTRRFGPKPLRVVATAYVELFRGTPVLLQLYLIYYGLPTLSPHLRFDALPAAILGLGLNYAAYESEIYRAAMDAVPSGQLEAATALGMRTPLAVRRILVPQALRYALPGITNDFIALLKDSSLVSVITVVELTKQMTITSIDVRSWAIPGALCAALYLAMSYPLSVISRRLEAKLDEAEEQA